MNTGEDIILQVKNLKKNFIKGSSSFTAVDGISFAVRRGECLGLIGESGCGKSTAAKLIVRLEKADEGEIILDGINMTEAGKKELKSAYKKIQMVFQTPQDSFDPRQKLKDAILEPLLNNGADKKTAEKRLEYLLPLVNLDEKLVLRYPHQVSGGQCQRAAIARAVAIAPQVLICDEATSALDVTVQKQITLLLKDLQKRLNLSILFICHDIALVQEMCSRILVMRRGKIVEEGSVCEIINNPQNEYTKLLIESAL